MADGDAESGLRAVFLANRPQLLRLLTARLGNRDDAEDALQDMWMRVDQLAAGPIAQPDAFLYRVAANLATDRRISAARRGARDSAWVETQPEAAELPDAERMLIARDDLRQLQARIEAMPERMRAALRMFRFEQQAQRAIADHLGISVSGVEKLLQRAYRIISFEGDEDDEDRGDRHRLEGKGVNDGGQ